MVSQSATYSASQAVHKTVNLSASQTNIQLVIQSISRQANLPSSQLVSHAANQSFSHPASQTVNQPTSQSACQVDNKSVRKPDSHSISPPVSQPANQCIFLSVSLNNICPICKFTVKLTFPLEAEWQVSLLLNSQSHSVTRIYVYSSAVTVYMYSVSLCTAALGIWPLSVRLCTADRALSCSAF